MVKRDSPGGVTRWGTQKRLVVKVIGALVLDRVLDLPCRERGTFLAPAPESTVRIRDDECRVAGHPADTIMVREIGAFWAPADGLESVRCIPS